MRQATPADLDAVVTLRLALLRASKKNRLYARLRSDVRHRIQRLCRSQLLAGQAENEGVTEVIFIAERMSARGVAKAVGLLRCAEVPGSPLTYPTAHGYISSAYVTPTARRQGVLHELVQYALQWCRTRGLSEVRLHCGIENGPASAAWNALGFEVVEHLMVRAIEGKS